MKNFYSIIRASLLVTALVSTSALADLSDILSSGKVKIAVPEAFAPFGSVGATGEHEGYDVDVAKLIAKDLGVELVWNTPPDFDRTDGDGTDMDLHLAPPTSPAWFDRRLDCHYRNSIANWVN